MKKNFYALFNLMLLFWLCQPIIFAQSKKASTVSTEITLIDAKKLEKLRKEILEEIDKKQVFSQQMVDMIFSFGELGFQEYETSNYITNILEKEGFTIEKGVSGIPTAWIAKWGSGKPVIALGSDIDCIPKASQKPGVAYHDPIIEGAPGHGEGHNSGQALNITAALVIKKIMEREKIAGTLVLWPGVAEELVGTKAIFVRDGHFKNIDACIFTHVANNLGVQWGDNGGNGLVSVKFNFEGEAAHAAGAPWRGKSALDAVELMNIGWNFKREHLYPSQRSHYVIVDGGDQPNVVPSKASVWYYFRERTYPKIKELYESGVAIAKGATMMTGTTMSYEVLGSAWPGHFNKPIAENVFEHIKRVGLPKWSEEDQLLATSLQAELKSPEKKGLAMKIDTTIEPVLVSMGGGSDDIADISWNLPTVVLRYPSNIPGLPGHHWANAISMATPIAHKGVTAGAKVEALTLLDMLVKPDLITKAWDYYKNEQTKDVKYESLISPTDKPAINLNQQIMAKFRPEMKKVYYDPTKYKSYMEQLGITYPTVRKITPTEGSTTTGKSGGN
ncbi:amidohydrolase [Arcicella lustrica]|uniref:Amidohydrolase n=1 Tax=Arcicella lustrica TaxID=2984196 RepID=A0ABU5SP57_9BACT|nr:amidohydrolase [Arcicella sp. DC25W]MEA5429103.1 amidohydrolase [Arcicella sp. DC25W]